MPNTASLHLDAAGVETSERGYIPVDEVGLTNVEHIRALGDVDGEGAFTHTSVNDGETFSDHYAGTGDRRLSDRIPIHAMYLDPTRARRYE